MYAVVCCVVFCVFSYSQSNQDFLLLISNLVMYLHCSLILVTNSFSGWSHYISLVCFFLKIKRDYQRFLNTFNKYFSLQLGDHDTTSKWSQDTVFLWSTLKLYVSHYLSSLNLEFFPTFCLFTYILNFYVEVKNIGTDLK